MLKGISPLVTGPLLSVLDRMGHSDEIVLADAHFPSFSSNHRGAERRRHRGDGAARRYPAASGDRHLCRRSAGHGRPGTRRQHGPQPPGRLPRRHRPPRADGDADRLHGALCLLRARPPRVCHRCHRGNAQIWQHSPQEGRDTGLIAGKAVIDGELRGFARYKPLRRHCTWAKIDSIGGVEESLPRWFPAE